MSADWWQHDQQYQEWSLLYASVPLSRGKSSLIDREDAAKVMKYKWHFNGRYAVRNAGRHPNRKTMFLHHVILPQKAGFDIDHINGDTLDNRKQNLRYATHRQNMRNRTGVAKPIKGVSQNGLKWRCRITTELGTIMVGNFYSPNAAAIAYNLAAKHYFGDFASLNEVSEFHEWLDEIDRDRLAELEKRFSSTIDYRRPTTWDDTLKTTEGEIFSKPPQERTLPGASGSQTSERITASTRASPSLAIKSS